MILALEDYTLAQDYLKTIKQQEAVLWEGRMVPIDIKNILPKDEILLIVILVLFLTGISIATFLPHYGLAVVLFTAFLSGYLFLLQTKQKNIRYYKLKYNRYLLTKKKCIFIHWYQQQIHINSIPVNSIQEVQTYRTSNGEVSILFHTKPASNFEMSYYVDNEKTDSVGFINIGQQANRITKIIHEQVLKEV